MSEEKYELPADFIQIPTEFPNKQNSDDFHRLWGPLLKQTNVYIPGLVQDSGTKEITGAPRPEPIPLYLIRDDQNQSRYSAVYTDTRVFADPQMVMGMHILEYLEEKLYETGITGIWINPPYKIVHPDIELIHCTLPKIGIAELMGFLRTGGERHEGIPYSQLAIDAFKRREYFQTIYFWRQSYRVPRPGDNWKDAELAKLKSYWQLNFPGVRQSAINELEHFMINYESTMEMEVLMENWIENLNQ